jgi:hypothetical protein
VVDVEPFHDPVEVNAIDEFVNVDALDDAVDVDVVDHGGDEWRHDGADHAPGNAAIAPGPCTSVLVHGAILPNSAFARGLEGYDQSVAIAAVAMAWWS